MTVDSTSIYPVSLRRTKTPLPAAAAAATTTAKAKSNKPSILQPKPKYQSSAGSVTSDADKRDDQPQQDRSVTSSTTSTDGAEQQSENVIPDQYIETITKGFGPNADLFKDILQVSPDAEPRKLRICYFRRGREVLTQGGVHGFDEVSLRENVPELARIRFQAVSMAYEIVSTPAWRKRYLEEGLKYSDNRRRASPVTVPSTLSVSSRPSVRWNEQVEELVFDKEPDEHALDEAELELRNRSKNLKAEIFIEDSSELDEHLAKLDAEAEPHFVTDFFDAFEESLDGLLKFAGNKDINNNNKADSSKQPTKEDSNNNIDTVSLTSAERIGGFIERVRSNDEDSIVGMLTSTLLGMSFDSKILLPLSSSEEKTPVPFRCVSPDPCTSESDEPDDQLFEVESITFSATGSVASETQSIKSKPSEDVFDGIEEELMTKKPTTISLTWHQRPTSPGNLSMASDLSESVANRDLLQTALDMDEAEESEDRPEGPEYSRPITPIFTGDLFNEDPPPDDYFEDRWCQPSEILQALPFGESKEEKENTWNEEARDDPGQDKPRYSEDDGFLKYLASFLQAMVLECESMGKNVAEIDWQDAVLDAFTVEDDKVDRLMKMVADEIARAPELQSEDAIQAPTQLAIEVARSFS